MRPTIGLIVLLLAAPVAAQGPGAGSASRGSQLPPAFATRKLDVEIPFAVTPGSDPQAVPTAVQVFVSWDHGRNWHKYTEVPADAGKFRFSWSEKGGPPVTAPAKQGFGSKVIKRAFASIPGSEAFIEYRPEGLVCRFLAPADQVAGGSS